MLTRDLINQTDLVEHGIIIVIMKIIVIDMPVTSALWITQKPVPLWDLLAEIVGAQLRVKTPLVLL